MQGSALAGGAGIVTACDIALANKDSHFGYPEVRRGLVAAQVSTLLRRQIVMRHVRELLLVGEQIDAQRALEIGLINRRRSIWSFTSFPAGRLHSIIR